MDLRTVHSTDCGHTADPLLSIPSGLHRTRVSEMRVYRTCAGAGASYPVAARVQPAISMPRLGALYFRPTVLMTG